MSGVQSTRRRGRVGRIVVAGAVVGSAAFATAAASPAHAAGGLVITEVAAWGSGNAPYAADWFEVTNTSGAAISVAGWTMDDSSFSAGSSVPMSGISSIAAGESVIFMETSTLSATAASFTTAWFAGSPPSGLQIGAYSGGGVGLSTGGDGVALYDTTSALRAKVSFGASPSAAPFASFDNAAGADNATISTLSVVGTNGAFAASSAIGSPGTATTASTPPSSTSSTSTTSTSTTVIPTALPWPGDQTVQDASSFIFGGNLSGLIEEASGTAAPGVLWGVRNGPGALYKLAWDGTKWAPATGDWSTGKALHYPNGTGDTDAEGVTFTDAGSAGGIFVSTERNNSASSTSRLSILRFDPSTAGTSLNATMEWNLTADLPAVGANLGLEAITWVPDTYLVANNFADAHAGHAYNPADYANHGTGLFLVGVEGTGMVHAYALDQVGGGFTRIASFSSTFPGVMELQFDRDLSELWAVCDDTCAGKHALFRLNSATGAFAAAYTFNRPTAMPNFNNEGFAIAAGAECVTNRKPVYWADDGEDLGVSIRSGNIPCVAFGGTIPPVVPEFPLSVLASLSALGLLGGVVLFIRRRQPIAI